MPLRGSRSAYHAAASSAPASAAGRSSRSFTTAVCSRQDAAPGFRPRDRRGDPPGESIGIADLDGDRLTALGVTSRPERPGKGGMRPAMDPR
ncbi:hypothetical protein BE08_11310 [Sorangium cellulosum]|uniref:Uncharacterized protein n=1 Tax=Sorangium cellulosum TaxID=56 RepID=A0A150P5D3_SORCE|nr:hypothetical protein BE08_11310 [Sorangium cellulosum]